MKDPEAVKADADEARRSHAEEGRATPYDDVSWVRTAENLFDILDVPQEGNIKIYAIRAFLEAAPEDFFQAHPREWAAFVVAAHDDGASWEVLAQSARVDLPGLRRRLELGGVTRGD